MCQRRLFLGVANFTVFPLLAVIASVAEARLARLLELPRHWAKFRARSPGLGCAAAARPEPRAARGQPKPLMAGQIRKQKVNGDYLDNHATPTPRSATTITPGVPPRAVKAFQAFIALRSSSSSTTQGPSISKFHFLLIRQNIDSPGCVVPVGVPQQRTGTTRTHWRDETRRHKPSRVTNRIPSPFIYLHLHPYSYPSTPSTPCVIHHPAAPKPI
jgi:hypothetical protein